MSSNEIVIDVRNISKRYEIYATPRDRLKQLVFPAIFGLFARLSRLLGQASTRSAPQYFREFWALHNVSFQVNKGETLGIVGRNGSGKSTLLELICSTLAPTGGDIVVNGRISALLELGSGFNPDYTGRENVFLNGQILGLSQKDIEMRFDSIVEFADIGEFIDQPVKTYSSGMAVRLAFAVAINVDPTILIIDEALAVGDIAFQRKCIAWLEAYKARGGTLLFVSHSPEQVRRLCDKALFLQHGNQPTIGPVKLVCDMYERSLYAAKADMPVAGDSPTVTEDKVFDAETNNASHLTPFPECAVHYGNYKARITEAWTENLTGIRKSCFRVGERIVWTYKVTFNEPVNSVVFGLMIKTKEGINLLSANSSSLTGQHFPFLRDDSVVIRFEIDSKLGPGEYFINCGVSAGDPAEMNFLHRITDAAIVTVMSADASRSGLVNMDVGFSYKQIKVAAATRVLNS